MSLEGNKALVRRFLEAQTDGDLATIAAMMAPDFVDHSVLPGQGHTREDYVRAVAEDQAAFSDSRLVVEDQVAEGDKVISRIRILGTHDQGRFAGIPATGLEMETTGITINRVVGGRIAEEWSESSGIHELLQERIEQEMGVARRIQEALLPKELPRIEGWEITPHYQPAWEVGGDFYDFLPLDDGLLGLIIGDVSGKGVAAALVMANTQSVLRAVARGGFTPGQLLAEANEVLSAYIPPNMFVTCFCGVLDPASGLLTYANAGHNLPCWQHEGLVRDLRATGMPLGLMPGMSYEEKEAALRPGDNILFYTDGLVEAHSPEREMFGSPRVHGLLTDHATGTSGLTTFVVEELERFTEDWWEQEDDITLVTLQRSRQGPEARTRGGSRG